MLKNFQKFIVCMCVGFTLKKVKYISHNKALHIFFIPAKNHEIDKFYELR